jgi:hypothetical protein
MYPATFLTTVDGVQLDLVQEFSTDVVLAKAKSAWDNPDIATVWHSRGTEAYYSRLFSIFITNSLMHEFLTILYGRIDPKYSMDGPLLLHTMCHHIHRNHIAFVESIKDKIRTTNLAKYKDDMAALLCFLQNYLRLISSTGATDTSNNDLVPHILTQLWCSKIPLFQKAILKWHRKYMEGKLSLTPMQLAQMADEESQILRHSNQWVETIDPMLTAFQALLQQGDTSLTSHLQSFLANLPRLSQLAAHPVKLN